MEIKTEHDIYWNYDTNTHKNKNKKWVSVETEIKFLEKLIFNYCCFECFKEQIKDKIKELKGDKQ